MTFQLSCNCIAVVLRNIFLPPLAGFAVGIVFGWQLATWTASLCVLSADDSLEKSPLELPPEKQCETSLPPPPAQAPSWGFSRGSLKCSSLRPAVSRQMWHICGIPPSRLHTHDAGSDREGEGNREGKKGKGPGLRISLVIFKWALSGIMQKLPQSDQNHAHNNKHYVMGKRKRKSKQNGKGKGKRKRNGKYHSKCDCNSLGRCEAAPDWAQLKWDGDAGEKPLQLGQAN